MVKAELVGINNEQNYPVGPDDRMIIWTLSFLIDTWLNYPAITRDAVIEEATANMLDDTIDIAGIDIGTVVVP